MPSYKHSFLLICLLFFSKGISQNFEESWTGHFSYLEIKDIDQSTDKLYCAAENAIFTYDLNTNEIETISSIQGISGEVITSILYIEDASLIVIGFETGLIQIYDEVNKTFLSVIDIVEKPTLDPTRKRINHFNRNGNIIYISTDFGISEYDIEALEFGDTFFIGSLGTQIKVSQTAIFEDYIYAASEQGIYKGLLSNTNLIDYQQWESFSPMNWVGIQTVEDKLYGATTNKRVYEIINNTISQRASYPEVISGFKSNNNQLIVTATRQVNAYTSNFDLIVNATTTEEYNSDFSTAIIANNSELYIGTNRLVIAGVPASGILKSTFTEPNVFEEIHPESPLRNRFYEVKYQDGQLWGIHGGHNAIFNFDSRFARTGISRFTEDSWQTIPYPVFDEQFFRPWYFSYLTVNPENANQIYISSFYSGLIEITDGEITSLYNGDNSTLTPFFGNFHLTMATIFDDEGNLWVTNGRYESPLNRFNGGQWTSFSYLDLIDPATSNNGYSSIVIDANDNVFTGTHQYGVVAFNENGGNPVFQNLASDEENMPSPSVKCLAIDRNNQLWIGTGQGLRVAFNTEDFIDNPEVDNIVILDDGVPQELLFQQYVSDIEVDGSNNKWIATLDTGLYYFSPDGQETLFHFTTENSPLPSNSVLDVEIDDVNGEIYIATDNGLVSFKSDASKPQDNLESAFIYPNPVRPSFNIVDEKIKIRDISDNVNIKITDIEGNLVAEAESRTNSRFKGYNLEIDGGTALWNGKNLGGNIVASGVYLVMLSDLDSFETKVLKVMVVR